MYTTTETSLRDGTYDKIFVMTQHEAAVLRKLLVTKLKVVSNKYERLLGILEAGEATDKDTDDLEYCRETFETLDRFLIKTENLK